MEKIGLLTYITQHLHEQMKELEQEIASIQEEMGKETKSSAGDKFETAREMMNQERARLEDRISLLQENLRAIREMAGLQTFDSIGFGALVKTNAGLFLMGAGIGKIKFEEQAVFILSLNSPLGKAFEGKKAGDQLHFMNKVYQIISVS